MMRNLTPRLSIAALSLALAQPAAAYIGPGAGLSLVGALWGLLLAVGAALLFLVMWPLRRALRRRNRARAPTPESTPRTSAGAKPGHGPATVEAAPPPDKRH